MYNERSEKREKKRDRGEQNSALCFFVPRTNSPRGKKRGASNTKRTSDYQCIEETEQTGGARACRATWKWKSEHSITFYLALN